MRRIALILLMALLPLQSIGAAAAYACAHERAPSGGHVAEAAPAHSHSHSHSHDPAHERADLAAATDDGSVEEDSERDSASASTCHGQGSAAVFACALVAPAPAAAGIVPSPYARFIAERFLESALRPPVLHHA